MSPQWQAYPDLGAAATACAQFITATLLQELSEQPEVTVAISGGESPKPLFHDLADAPIPWDRVHLFWVDERAVPPNNPQSNFKLADELLITPGRLPLRNIHRIQAELPPSVAAARYVADIRKHFRLGPGELPEFTLIHQGIGGEGHTASLFPGEKLLDDRAGIASSLHVDAVKADRITLLPGVLLKAKHTVFLVEGAAKAEIVDNIFNGEFTPHQYPAQLFARQAPDVHWFLDDAAAATLAGQQIA